MRSFDSGLMRTHNGHIRTNRYPFFEISSGVTIWRKYLVRNSPTTALRLSATVRYGHKKNLQITDL